MGSSIADVARLSGVSVATVSRALRGLPNVSETTRDRVRAAADELDYVADPNAARLAGQRAGTLGIVVPMLSSWYHGRLIEAVEQAAEAADHHLLPYVLRGDGRLDAFVHDLPFRKRVDGLIVADLAIDASQTTRLLGAGVPVVTTDAALPCAATVRIDDRAAAVAAAEHLLALGHRRIAVIGGPGPAPEFTVPHLRVRGVTDALAGHGLELDPRDVVCGAFRAQDGERGMERLLAAGRRPTAVVALSDEMAIGAIHAARAAGLRVPDDLSVVGFDDHDLARHVDLTTIRQDVGRIGRELVALLLDLVDGSSDPADRHRTVPTTLVVRGTTAPPPFAGAARDTDPHRAGQPAGRGA